MGRGEPVTSDTFSGDPGTSLYSHIVGRVSTKPPSLTGQISWSACYVPSPVLAMGTPWGWGRRAPGKTENTGYGEDNDASITLDAPAVPRGPCLPAAFPGATPSDAPGTAEPRPEAVPSLPLLPAPNPLSCFLLQHPVPLKLVPLHTTARAPLLITALIDLLAICPLWSVTPGPLFLSKPVSATIPSDLNTHPPSRRHPQTPTGTLWSRPCKL